MKRRNAQRWSYAAATWLLVAGGLGCGRPTPAEGVPPAGAVASTALPMMEKPKDTYGAPLGAATERVALHDLVNAPAQYANKTVRVEGQVTSVCQNMGCWLELGEATSSAAHVKLQGHRFFVPRTSVGKRAKVEARVLPAVDSGHCEQEAQEQTGTAPKVELEATGVEIYRN